PLCNGSSPLTAQCGPKEDCMNGIDDDCNGLVDKEDPACNSCNPDGVGSPDANAPILEPGKYDGLQICPGKSDLFGIQALPNQTIRATITMQASRGLLDLYLIDTDGKTTLDFNQSQSDSKSVSYAVGATGGKYLLQVAG